VDVLTKPRLRGVFHQYAFYVAVVAGVVLVAVSDSGRELVATWIYAAALAAMFGVSALYHRVDWKSTRVRTHYLRGLESLAVLMSASYLRATLAYASPLVAADDQAEDLYQAALGSDLINWPCFRGRLLLSYGRWLRRQRRVAESRAPLRAARENFDALGFHGLSESARQELRASGETSLRRTPDAIG
jgi:hypothetical protein